MSEDNKSELEKFGRDLKKKVVDELIFGKFSKDTSKSWTCHICGEINSGGDDYCYDCNHYRCEDCK